ncbi:hypothetical protein V8E36_002198 [Tilletia maclaganii]
MVNTAHLVVADRVCPRPLHAVLIVLLPLLLPLGDGREAVICHLGAGRLKVRLLGLCRRLPAACAARVSLLLTSAYVVPAQVKSRATIGRTTRMCMVADRASL